MIGALTHWAVAAVGVWLMAAPAVLGFGESLTAANRVIGPIVATFAVVAVWEATRPLRRVNVAMAVLLAALTLAFAAGNSGPAVISNLAAAAATLLGSLVRGELTNTYGGGWSVLWNPADARTKPAAPAATREAPP